MPSSQLLDPGDPSQVAGALEVTFTARTGRAPTVVARAPGRVNLIGEHVDYNGGRCLPLALPHATYAALAPRRDRLLSVTSAQMQETRELDLDSVGPGRAEGWVAYVAGVLWALADEGWDVPGLDVVVDSRVPVGAGLSSSAALECAVAVGLLPVCGVEDGPEVRRTLARACVRAEVEVAGAPTGGLDQSIALLGREGHALLLDFAEASDRPLPWTPEAEGLTLLVVDTRVSHALVDGGYAARRADCEEAARALGIASLRALAGRPERVCELEHPRLRRRVRHVVTEMLRVDTAVALLGRGDHAGLGPVLDASHVSLRDDYEVSCAELDTAVETCRDAGALGARMTGGGFGGSAIALVPADRLDDVATAVTVAFADRGWSEPGFLQAPASAGAERLR